MKSRLIVLLPVFVLILVIGGCGSDSPTTSDVPNAFKGKLSLVVLTVNGGNPTGVDSVPVIVTVMDQVDPGPYSLDTVYTNQCGVAYFIKPVGCTTFDTRGKLVVTVGDADPFDVYFGDGEDISEIIDFDSLATTSR